MSRNETVEEYLKRGGHITTLKPSPAARHIIAEASRQSTQHKELIPTVPWKDLYSDGTADDPQYWKELNRKMDEVLKKTWHVEINLIYYSQVSERKRDFGGGQIWPCGSSTTALIKKDFI